jgi:hypothetical protein
MMCITTCCLRHNRERAHFRQIGSVAAAGHGSSHSPSIGSGYRLAGCFAGSLVSSSSFRHFVVRLVCPRRRRVARAAQGLLADGLVPAEPETGLDLSQADMSRPVSAREATESDWPDRWSQTANPIRVMRRTRTPLS